MTTMMASSISTPAKKVTEKKPRGLKIIFEDKHGIPPLYSPGPSQEKLPLTRRKRSGELPNPVKAVRHGPAAPAISNSKDRH